MKFNKKENNEPHSIMDAVDEATYLSIFDRAFEGEDAQKAETVRRSHEDYELMQQQAQELISNTSFELAESANQQFAMQNPYAFSANQPLVGVSSVIGRRKSQQDAVAVTSMVYGSFPQEKWMAVLSDGMGGMNGGELASSTCVNQFLSSFDQGFDSVPEFFRDEIDRADEAVYTLSDENGENLGGGATVVSVIIENGGLYLANVGDSHIYIIRDNQIILLSEEHNYLARLLEDVKSGMLTEEEAYADKNKDALTSYIGLGGISLMQVYSKPLPLLPNDIIVLSSDGLYRALLDEEIRDIVLANQDNMEQAALKLTDSAMAKNFKYQDNTSVILIKYI